MQEGMGQGWGRRCHRRYSTRIGMRDNRDNPKERSPRSRVYSHAADQQSPTLRRFRR